MEILFLLLFVSIFFIIGFFLYKVINFEKSCPTCDRDKCTCTKSLEEPVIEVIEEILIEEPKICSIKTPEILEELKPKTKKPNIKKPKPAIKKAKKKN